jgi:hypothetical protein
VIRRVLLFPTLIFGTALVVTSPLYASNCPLGKQWVSPHFRSGYVRYDGIVVSPTNVIGHCKTNPRGFERWHSRLSNSRPKIWGYKEKTKQWTTEEIERIYDFLDIFPPHFGDLEKIKIYRMDSSLFKGNPATTNFNDVVLYDAAFKHSVPLEQILAHELAHSVYNTLDAKEKRDFAVSANWEQDSGSGNWVPKKEKAFIQSDSRASLDEDFANHVEHYLFENNTLKESSPNAYQWIKEKFGQDFKIQEKK